MLNQQPIWQQLKEHQKRISSLAMSDLFSNDKDRFERFSLEADHIFLDYSKNRIVPETLDYLIELAECVGLKEQIEALFQGKAINTTENRPALHTLVRQTDNDQTLSEMKQAIERAMIQMERVVNEINDQTWLGFSGKPITDIVNIGIGGSNLGPLLGVDALKYYRNPKLSYHFISNVDGSDLSTLLSQASPETTLFILSSKSFSTPETLYHAETIKAWILEHANGNQNALQKHVLAVTANPEKAKTLGLSSNQIFPIWDWIGGRFSIWSAVGLPLAIAIGMKEFKNLLKGALDMDQHFRTQPFKQNMPVILALLSIWYINMWNIPTQAIIPYTDLLRHFPAYLQQLEMESNGKSVNRMGESLTYSTAPVILGGIGTDAQHSFFQWLHQGTQWVPIDFIAVIKPEHHLTNHHRLLLASCLAQSQALMQGRGASDLLDTPSSLVPHRIMTGNRPSNLLLMPELSPYTLGALVALYEHKTIVEGMIWEINSFDQWGVELGKQLTQTLLDAIKNKAISKQSVSTQKLLMYINKHDNNFLF